MGHIGKRVARILRYGFGMNVVYYSRTKNELVENELDAKFVSLNELCLKADIISVHALYSDESIGLIDETHFELMKKEVVLINTARAELVDCDALKEALTEGKIAFAAFDCYYEEPVPSSQDDKYGLLAFEDNKFIITPHTAYKTENAVQYMESIAIENTIQVLQGEKCKNIVNNRN
jgi:lactate dehydrogenase-like 2-hydroxyacid dehydrogenase